ncbi:hypothetical protein [Streptomyces sp. CB01881]|uniref:hypothetical protein n=1 Tax=Streptomyces sp. CB01881 TaxID=2078691 RepID=UPI00129C94F5|nr:hypothetical protein [Streptomyces sp. CB01881]
MGGLAGAGGNVLAVAFTAQHVLEDGVVVVALGTGFGGVVAHALPLGADGAAVT